MLYISDITGWIYIGCLCLCLPAHLLSVDAISLIRQLAAEPQVDAARTEMKVSHLNQFAFTNSVHPVCVCLKSSSLQLCINIWGITRSTLKSEIYN